MSEPPKLDIQPEPLKETNQARVEDAARTRVEDAAFANELQKEAQAQGFLGKIWGGKDNVSDNIVGLIIILLILFLFLVFMFAEEQRSSIVELVKILLPSAVGYFVGSKAQVNKQ